MDRREPSQDEQGELELELEYFERVGLTARLALLRVAGTWAGAGAAAVDAPGLIVDDGLRERRFKPIAEPLEPEAATWRAAYAVPVELTALPEVTYALDAGSIVDLPNPTDRTLASAPPAPQAPLPAPASTRTPTPVAPNGNGRHLDVEDLATEPATPRPVGRNGHVPPPVVRLSPEPIREDEEAALVELAQLADGNRRPRWRALAVALAALVFVVGAGLLAVAVGSSDSSKSPARSARPSPARSASTPTPRAPARPIALAALPGVPTGAGATLQPLPGGRAELSVHGLPSGRYEAWLYRSLVDARPLGTFRGPAARLALRLGPNAARYPFLDISHEDDANPAHSGRSVLRVPLAAVRRGAAAGPGR